MKDFSFSKIILLSAGNCELCLSFGFDAKDDASGVARPGEDALAIDNAATAGDETALACEKTVLAGDNAALDGEKAAMAGDNAILADDNTALDGDNAAIDGDNAALDVDDAVLAGVNIKLAGDNAALDGDNPASDGDDAALTGVNTTLTGDDAALDGDNAALDSDDAVLAGVIVDMIADVGAVVGFTSVSVVCIVVIDDVMADSCTVSVLAVVGASSGRTNNKGIAVFPSIDASAATTRCLSTLSAPPKTSVLYLVTLFLLSSALSVPFFTFVPFSSFS